MRLNKVKRYRNKKYLAAARDQSCTINLIGCNFNPETVVAAHSPFDRAGMGMKTNDWNIIFCCDSCHSCLDRRTPSNYSRKRLEELFNAARERTHGILINMGLMKKSEIGVIK